MTSGVQASGMAQKVIARIRAAALGVVGAAAALSAAGGETIEVCDMLRAFDQALQMRYYQANLAPSEFGCTFYSREGCRYALPRDLVIRVTHLEPVGCAESGECSFRARQTCEIAEIGAYCSAIMAQRQSDYLVIGRFAATEGGMELTDWRREPTEPLDASAQIGAVCPELQAG